LNYRDQYNCPEQIYLVIKEIGLDLLILELLCFVKSRQIEGHHAFSASLYSDNKSLVFSALINEEKLIQNKNTNNLIFT
jgi:hypothetical protein